MLLSHPRRRQYVGRSYLRRAAELALAVSGYLCNRLLQSHAFLRSWSDWRSWRLLARTAAWPRSNRPDSVCAARSFAFGISLTSFMRTASCELPSFCTAADHAAARERSAAHQDMRCIRMACAAFSTFVKAVDKDQLDGRKKTISNI